ncbi:amidohydrolase family protein [Fodinicurvata sp. EGI_FJ10296]|uniref:amidohydrolase family protein n=1 Tax=Fodinicurvata sp. EGI_FJ10296 TaxID=3231908 RepID=UPI0034533607
MTADIIDSHLHLWDTDHLDYGWLAAVPPINRPHLPAEAMPLMREAGVESAVFVQAECRRDQSVEEVHWVSGLAAQGMPIRGIVAWAPLEAGDDAAPTLDRLAEIPLVRGVRRLIQDEPDPDFCLREEFISGVKLLGRYSLSFDICIRASQFDAALGFAAKCPDIPMVLDHLGKPPIASGDLREWRRQMRALAAMDHVFAKLSGLATEAGSDWTVANLDPCLDVALETFGPDRLMFGSDWPVCTLATTYPQWAAVIKEYLAKLSESERRAVLSESASRFYRLA